MGFFKKVFGLEVIKKFGGNVQKVTNGRQESAVETEDAVVHFALVKKCLPGLMIYQQ